MLDINVKNATNILSDKDNQIVASNKSKAKLSIVDKIKSYYYQRRLDVIDVKMDELEYNQQVFSDDMKRQEEKFGQLSNEGNADELTKINNDYLEDQENIEEIDEQLQDLSEQREEYQEKLDNINSKLEPITPTDSVSDEMVESAMKKAQEELKNNVESMSMEQVKEETRKSPIEAILDEYKVRDNELFNALIERIEKVYEDMTIQRVNAMQAKTEEEMAKANNVITNLNNKIAALTSELETTKQNLEQTTNELTQTKNKVSEQDQTIMDLKLSLNTKDEEISARDEQLKSKDNEIATLKEIQNDYIQVKRLLNKDVQPSIEEQSKTL